MNKDILVPIDPEHGAVGARVAGEQLGKPTPFAATEYSVDAWQRLILFLDFLSRGTVRRLSSSLLTSGVSSQRLQISKQITPAGTERILFKKDILALVFIYFNRAAILAISAYNMRSAPNA